jgi:hypothetical protein
VADNDEDTLSPEERERLLNEAADRIADVSRELYRRLS